ncbi:MAG: hypothetical protein ACK4VO_04290 [Pseudobdellovibrio sp.]
MKIKALVSCSMILMGISISTYANQLEALKNGVGSDAVARKAYERASQDEIIAKINQEVDLYCNGKNLCKFVSKTSEQKGWSVSFSLGNGPINSTGTNIYLGGDPAALENRNSVGVTIRYDNKTCESYINIGHSEMQNVISRLYSERDGDLSQMKPMTSDTKFEKLLKLEYAKLLSNSGCSN